MTRRGISTRFRGLAVLVAVLAASVGVHAESADIVRWVYGSTSDTVVDVLAAKGGTVLVVFRQGGVGLLRPGSDTPVMLPKPSGSGHSFTRVFPGRKGKEGLLLVDCSNGVRVYAWRDGKWQTAGSTSARISTPICYQDASGAIWVNSRTGDLFRCFDGKVEVRRFGTKVQGRGTYYQYPTLRAMESKTGEMCFFTQFGATSTTVAMKTLLSYKDGKWREIDDGGIYTGGGFFSDDGTVMVAHSEGICEVKLGTGDRIPTKIRKPTDDDYEYYRPVFMKRLPDGTIVSQWLVTPKNLETVGSYRQGIASRLVEYKDGQWKVVGLSADSGYWDYYGYERPSLLTKDGEFLLGTCGGGVLYRRKDGTWYRVDWRGGMPFNNPCRLALGSDGVLWVVDRLGGCVAVHLDKALARRAGHAGDKWHADSPRSELRALPDGYLTGASLEKGGCLVKFGPKGKEYVPVDSRQFNMNSLSYLAVDTAGGVWLFSSSTYSGTAHYDGKKWSIYKPDEALKMPGQHKELAFQAQIWRGEKFRIGRPTDLFYPIFTKDGRIVFKNEYHRVCYFDGRQWHAPYGGSEVNRNSLHDSQPFFHDGKVTIVTRGHTYQMDEKDWTKGVDDQSTRKWKEVQAVPYPFPKPTSASSGVSIPTDCPIRAEERRWTFARDGWTWVGGVGKLACSPGKGWVSVDTLFSPVGSGYRVRLIQSDPAGRWWFLPYGTGYDYVYYQGGTLTLEAAKPDLGRLDRPFVTVKIPVKSNRKLTELVMRCRLDGGEWFGLGSDPAFETGVLAHGKHVLECEAFGRGELVRSNRVAFELDVTYNPATLIGDVIKRFGSESFRERKQASVDIVKFGASALAQLRAAAKSRDPEIATRAAKAIEEIEKSDKDKKPAADPNRVRRSMIMQPRAMPLQLIRE